MGVFFHLLQGIKHSVQAVCKDTETEVVAHWDQTAVESVKPELTQRLRTRFAFFRASCVAH